jgi:hypothetical protein
VHDDDSSAMWTCILMNMSCTEEIATVYCTKQQLLPKINEHNIYIQYWFSYITLSFCEHDNLYLITLQSDYNIKSTFVIFLEWPCCNLKLVVVFLLKSKPQIFLLMWCAMILNLPGVLYGIILCLSQHADCILCILLLSYINEDALSLKKN